MHLGEMPVLAFPPNIDLLKGFTVPQLAEKHACPVKPLLHLFSRDGFA
jgi:hypothetical protein